jgi:anti-sigma B factor antagonist
MERFFYLPEPHRPENNLTQPFYLGWTMIITKAADGPTVTLSLAGRLDTVTSVDLSKEIDALLAQDAVNLTLDFKDLDYISSAGLRVLIQAQKQVDGLGRVFEITSATENVKKIFEMTGLATLLNMK